MRYKKIVDVPQPCRKCQIPIYKPSRGSWWLCAACYKTWEAEYARKWRAKNPERTREHLRKAYREGHRFRKKQEHYKIILEYKNKPCTDCGNQFPPCAMDYDHVRGTKSFDIGRAATSARKVEQLLEEIAKCDVVCSNCHRVRTHSRKQAKMNIEK